MNLKPDQILRLVEHLARHARTRPYHREKTAAAIAAMEAFVELHALHLEHRDATLDGIRERARVLVQRLGGDVAEMAGAARMVIAAAQRSEGET